MGCGGLELMLVGAGGQPAYQQPGGVQAGARPRNHACLPLATCRTHCLSPPQTDGERLPLAVKDLGSSDIYPQSLQHSPNGRFVTVRRRRGWPGWTWCWAWCRGRRLLG